MTQFKALNLIPELCSALTDKHYSEATTIQAKAIPVVLEGCDLMASAQTGTGKTLLLSCRSYNGWKGPTSGRPLIVATYSF